MSPTERCVLLLMASIWVLGIVLFVKGIQTNNPAGYLGGGALTVLVPFIWADMYRIMMTGG